MAQVEFQIPIVAKINRHSDDLHSKGLRDSSSKDDKVFSQLIEEKGKSEPPLDGTKVIEQSALDLLQITKPSNDIVLQRSEFVRTFGEGKEVVRESKAFNLERQSLAIKDLRNHMREARLNNRIIGENNHMAPSKSVVEAALADGEVGRNGQASGKINSSMHKTGVTETPVVNNEAVLDLRVVSKTDRLVRNQGVVEAPLAKTNGVANKNEKQGADLQQISVALKREAKQIETSTPLKPNEGFQSRIVSKKSPKGGAENPERMMRVEHNKRFQAPEIKNLNASRSDPNPIENTEEIGELEATLKIKLMPIDGKELKETGKKINSIEWHEKGNPPPAVKVISIGQPDKSGQAVPSAMNQITEKIGILVSQEHDSLVSQTSLTSPVENIEKKTISKTVKFLTIQLKPDNLGTISVKMLLVGHKFLVSIMAENHNIAKQLNADIANLKLQIQAVGLVIDDISIGIKESEFGAPTKDFGDGDTSKTLDRETSRQGQSTDQRATKNQGKSYEQGSQQTNTDEGDLPSDRVGLDGVMYL